MLTAVLDTNLLLSALTGGRQTTAIYEALKAHTFLCLTSPSLLSELLAVLARQEFAISVEELGQIRTFLLLHTTLIELTKSLSACRDPDDNRVLECAVSAHAQCIVTGDRDLLVLHPFRGINIVTPKVFLQDLTKSQ